MSKKELPKIALVSKAAIRSQSMHPRR